MLSALLLKGKADLNAVVDAGNSSAYSSTLLANITLVPTRVFDMYTHEPQADLMSHLLRLHHSFDDKVVVRAVCAIHAVSQASAHNEVLLDGMWLSGRRSSNA